MVSLDQSIAWENIETVRNFFLIKYNGYSCHYLLPNENIRENINLFMDLTNASSSNIKKNLTKEVINCGTVMFLYLNSCPPTTKAIQENYNFFKEVLKKYLFEPTNSGIILYTLNAMKLFPNDGRIIASKILEKITTLFGLSSIQSQKLDLSREPTKGILTYVDDS